MVKNYFRSGWAVIAAEFYLTAADATALCEPGAQPFIRARLDLLPLRGIKRQDRQRWHTVERHEVRVAFGDDGAPDLPDVLTAEGKRRVVLDNGLVAIDEKPVTDQYRVLNMDEVRLAARKAARKIFAGK